jgi:Uma2 family endonuclease
MGAGTLISVEEYLSTSYSPDREFRDGVLVERNVGDYAHSLLQAALAAYFRRRRKRWQIQVLTELRIKVREGWYPLPDVCVYSLPNPTDRYPSTPPLLWIEILSDDDTMSEVRSKASELIACGVPWVWIIDPHTLESELHSKDGVQQVREKTLRLPGTPIEIPLQAVLEE